LKTYKVKIKTLYIMMLIYIHTHAHISAKKIIWVKTCVSFMRINTLSYGWV